MCWDVKRFRSNLKAPWVLFLKGKEIVMSLIKSVYFHKDKETTFPYHLPFFNQLIDLDHDITILVGDNGSGKSTLLELMRTSLNLFQIGKPMQEMKQVKADFKFALTKPRGFYFSSEDFTTYIYELEKEKSYAKAAINEVNDAYKHKSSFARQQAKGPYQKTLYEVERLHDRDLLKSSHGESYLSFFKSRLVPNYFILLDEPETPLSFQNQLSLLYMLKEAIDDGCQLIIATHSPLIMAYPGAHILEITDEGIHEKTYEDIENVQMMKDFLNHPDRYFNYLFK